MPVIHMILILALIGAALWAVHTYIPMAQPIKNILTVATVFATVIWLLNLFGVFSSMTAMRVG